MPELGKQKSRGKKKLDGGTDRRNVWLLVATALLLVASVALFMPPQEKINQGLDIQGGLSVVLSAESTDGSAITDEQMESSRSIIESRVDALGASEAVVQVQGDNQILVQIPGLSDTEAALEAIGRTGKLEFARLDSFTDETVRSTIDRGGYVTGGTVTDDFGNTFATDSAVEYMEVEEGTYTPLITGENIERVTVEKESDTSAYYAVALRLDAEGTKAFADATAELAPTKGKIVIILDGEVHSAPAVQSEIPNGEVSITGGYDLEDAQALQAVLESGSLPVSFEYEQSQSVGPTLGQDALRSGVVVAGIGLLLVLVYLLFFYNGLGLIAAAAMVVFAVIYLGILALLSHFDLFSLSLAGVAGIVLTIGMAADSSILTLERFCEEIRMGRSVRAASMTGVRHAILTSIDADLVSMVSALTLFFLASASVKGFGLTLALGIMCDIIMMLLFKAPLIRVLAPHVMRKHTKFWNIKASQDAAAAVQEAVREAGDTPGSCTTKSFTVEAARKLKGRFIKLDINFLGVRKVLLSVSAVLVALSIAFMGVRGLNFGIEFVGGTSVTFTQTGDITIDQMRDAMAQAGEPDAVIQTTQTNGENGFLVRTSTTDAEEATAHATDAAEQLGVPTENFQVSTIGPDWGASVVRSSLIAFVVSLLLIIAYIGIRFRDYKMGIVAVVTLLHDLIIVIGVYALVGREVTPNTIAALLTILGYSLYDTVVVFHRINDNMQSGDIKCTFMTMANHSVNQVFVRSINTSITSLVPVVAMLLFGGETLKDFALAMSVGLAVGVYSSIAVASPLYAMWKTREPRYAKLVRRYGTNVGIFAFGNPQPIDQASAELASDADATDGKEQSSKQSSSKAKKKSKRSAKR
ncbi:protein translocase subunit SecD [Adlercreutzia sp. ZJ141]|uniref:protein translocase subunit SecD n=1 Tax=Adlercreutzia sp. ZJ141 TaxID=2709406 RepID=UPI0013EBBAC8|nr:protein translocase subunit SecD [Adlercreutzia sp. ZJ141]